MADDIKKQVKKIEDAVNSALKTFTSSRNLTKYGNSAVDIIYKRTKTGKGVESDKSDSTSIKALKPLSDAYKKQRKKYKGKKGAFFSPARSNLTRTGQLLESIKSKVSDGNITVYLSGQRDDGQNNEDVGGYVSDNGRPFLNLANEEKQILLRKVETDLINFIRQRFNRRG